MVKQGCEITCAQTKLKFENHFKRGKKLTFKNFDT